MARKTLLLLLAIVLAALALRTYNLAENPPGLTWDEASLGYNAYSLLQTGKDEYGATLPLTLKSFGDYKPAGYAYLTIPSIAVFGLNEFGVRLPNALMGVGAVIVAFFLVRKLTDNDALGLLTAAVIAFSPWAIHFSRGAWEANTALTTVLLATYLFFKGLEQPRWMIASAVCFAASLYTYQSSRLFVPLLLIGLVVMHWKTIFPNGWKLQKAYIVAAGLGLILLMPFFVTISNATARQRLTVQNLFSYRRSDAETTALAKEEHIASTSAQFKLFHSQNEQWVRAIIERELQYISPSFLFVTGDTSFRHRAPNVAHGYFVDIVFYLIGIYALARSKLKNKGFFIFWLLIAPIPAVLSRDSTQALRALQTVFAVDFLIAFGLWAVWHYIKHKLVRYAIYAVIALAYLGNLVFYLDSYYVHLPKRTGSFWLTGYKPAIEAISNISDKYDQVIFTTDYNAPYIYVLFYLKVDPKHYQEQAKLTATRGIDVGEVETFDNFRFRHIYWPNDRSLPNTLFVGTDEELPEKDLVTESRAQLLKTIEFADGKPALKIVQTQ